MHQLAKLDLILRLMRILTTYCHVPHLFPIWAIAVAKREGLASTGLGRGFEYPSIRDMAECFITDAGLAAGYRDRPRAGGLVAGGQTCVGDKMP
jgi:hypothetical protein